MKKQKKIWIPLTVLAVLVIIWIWYVNDYYHSDVSIEEYQNGDARVEVTEIREGLYLNGPASDCAMIFYPGAKVEYTAYLPLLYELADQGIDCFLVKMPCNLAFLGKDKAEDIMTGYEYESWYLSGHSLGGAMAASYAAEHLEELDGLILLAAYPTKSLESDLFSVVSVYGSEDGVLNMDKLESGRDFMPDDYTEVCIDGGNHAQFGNYGEQEGDGIASVSREEQQEQTAEAILMEIRDSDKK